MFIHDMKQLEEQFNSWKDHLPNTWNRYNEVNPNDNVIAKVMREEDGKPLADYFFGANLVVETGEHYYVQKMTDSTITNNFANGTMVLNNPTSADTIASDDDFSDVNSPLAGSYSSLASVTIVTGGSGYVQDESVTITGNTSSAANAVATANVTAGALTSVTITDGGSGYQSGETVTITSTGGSGANDATITLPLLTAIELDNQDAENAGRGQYIITWKQSYLASSFEATTNAVTGGAIVADNAPSGTDPLLNHWNFNNTFTKQLTEPLDVWVNHDLAGV